MTRFIGTHRERFGGEPICRELQVAPETPAGWSPRPATVTSLSAWSGLVAPSGGTLVRATTLTEPVCRTAGFRGLQQAGDARRRQSSIQSGLISGSYETLVQH